MPFAPFAPRGSTFPPAMTISVCGLLAVFSRLGYELKVMLGDTSEVRLLITISVRRGEFHGLGCLLLIGAGTATGGGKK